MLFSYVLHVCVCGCVCVFVVALSHFIQFHRNRDMLNANQIQSDERIAVGERFLTGIGVGEKSKTIESVNVPKENVYCFMVAR